MKWTEEQLEELLASPLGRLVRDFNCGPVHLRTEHCGLAARVLRVDGTAGPDVHMLTEAGADFLLQFLHGRVYMKVLDHILPLYSQRDPRWRNKVYAGGMTFKAAGCYVTSVAMMLGLAGYTDDPPTVAAKLCKVGCFSGALLGRPDRIPAVYPLMRYDGPVSVGKDGPLRWHHGEADMKRVKKELDKGPCIIEVDFIPPTAKFNQHFVVAERFTADDKDLVIADPWDGTRTRLLERYAQDHWDLKRAIYGMRLLRVK